MKAVFKGQIQLNFKFSMYLRFFICIFHAKEKYD